MRTGLMPRRLFGQAKYGLGNKAFSIVETLIFLAVSGALFLLAATTIGGQQAKTEFTQSVQNFQSRLLDLANDVSTGYYANSGDFSCDGTNHAALATVTIAHPAVNNQGSNSGCIFAGQVLIFNVSPPSATFTLYPLAGKEKTTVGVQVQEVRSIAQALPVAITWASQTEKVTYGTVVGRMTFDTGTGPQAATGVLFASTFGAYSGNTLNSGDIQTDLIPLTSSVLPDWTLPASVANKNPANGVKICLQNGASATRHADVILGGNGRQLTTNIIYGNGSCS